MTDIRVTSRFAGLVVALLVSACVRDEHVLSPKEPRVNAQSAGGPLGPPLELDIPQHNEQGFPSKQTGFVVPPGVIIKATVSGLLTYNANPGRIICQPGVPLVIPPGGFTTIGPIGFPDVPGYTYIGGAALVSLGTDIDPGEVIQMTPHDPQAPTVSGTIAGPGVVWITRHASFPGSCSSEGTGYQPDYFVSGSQTLTVEIVSPPTVTITASVTTPNPGVSFTTKPAEATIGLHASVTPADVAPRVKWRVEPNPAHFPTPPLPDPMPEGAEASFLVKLVTPLGEARWPHEHLASRDLAPKQLSYRLTATVQDDAGQTHESNAVTATQDEIDTIREEYVELSRPRIPDRGVWGTNASTHFTPNDLNQADYTLYWAENVMLDGLEAMRSLLQTSYADGGLPFSGLPLKSAFRNPVHHRFHISSKRLTNDSPHMYGIAADIGISGQPVSPDAFFRKLRRFAKDPEVDACFEPAAMIRKGSRDGTTLDHAHVDWRAVCPKGW
jgi:hypothetical protein